MQETFCIIYQIGTKRMNHDKDKTKNANYYLLTLASIAKEIEAQNLSRRLSVDLSVGLPLLQMKRDTEKFKRYLMQNEETIYFVFENNEYEITINSIRLNVQGFAGVFHEWIHGDLEQDEPISCVVEIGVGTTEFFIMIDDEPQSDKMDSFDMGIIHLLRDIKKNLQAQNNASLMDEQIEKYLQKQKITIANENIAVIEQTAQAFADTLIGRITEYLSDLKNTPFIFMGGGASILKPYIKKSINSSMIRFVDDVHINAKGYEVLANGF